MINIILTILSLIVLPYYFFITSNILQNQYYDLKRYFIYISQNKRIIIFKMLLMCITIILSMFDKYFICFLFILLIKKYNNNRHFFKFTNRVKRQFIVFFILLSLNTVFIIFKLSFYLQTIYIFFIYWISFLISVLIEKLITKHYIKIAKNKICNSDLIIIAITGSFGKTSCKNYIYDFLKNDYNVLMTPKSFNTLNGVLLTINTLLKPYHNVLILEIGLDKKGGIDKFLKFLPIDIALVTSIGAQHLKTFKSIKNIANEKNKIFITAKKYSIVNIDNSYIDSSKSNCEKIFVSTAKKSDISIKIIEESLQNTKFSLQIYNESFVLSSNLIGKHNYENLACAIGVAKALDIDNKVITQVISKLKNVEHRLSLIKTNDWTIIDDSYNSNPIGFFNAVELFKNIKNLKVIITPGIIEKNNDDELDKKIAYQLIKNFDLIILINNPSFSHLIDKKISFYTFKEAYNYLKENYSEQSLTILIENDLPEIFIK